MNEYTIEVENYVTDEEKNWKNDILCCFDDRNTV